MKRKKNLDIFIITTVIVFIMSINISNNKSLAKQVSLASSIANKMIYSVNNTKDFCSMLPYCISNNIPLIITNDENYEPILQFSKSYRGTIKKIESREIIPFLRSDFNSETLIICEENNNKIVLLGTQLACKNKCPIIYEKEIKNFLEKNNAIKNIVILGDINFVNDGNFNVQRYKSIDEISKLYNETIDNSNLNVYVDSARYDVYGLYLSAYRNGKMYFDINEIKNANKYFAWVTEPQKFSPSKYLDIYSFLEKNTDNGYDKGIGLITANFDEDVNLLLLRSFFYNDMEKNQNLLEIQPMNNKKNYYYKGIKGTYDVINQHIDNFDVVLKKMQNAKYIKIFGHGNPNEILFEDKMEINTKNFPQLNNSIIIAEACSTCENLNDDSIALEAINKGAVAYIGSIKNGGVESLFLENPYLYSTEEIPLSTLVLINNIEIKKYLSNSIRAILIGDPLWSMNKSIGTWNKDGTYEYNLPYGFDSFDSKYSIPIKTNNDFDAKTVVITNNNLTNKNYDKITKIFKLGKSNIIFVNSDKYIGTIKFSNNYTFKDSLNKYMNYYSKAVKEYVDSFLQDKLVSIIQVFFCIVVIYFIFAKTNEKIKIQKKQIILTVIDSIIIASIIFLTMNVRLNYLVLLYIVLSFYILHICSSIKNKIVLLSLCMIIPLYIILFFAQGNKYLYLYSLIGMITFITAQLLIFLITNKIVKKIKI